MAGIGGGVTFLVVIFLFTHCYNIRVYASIDLTDFLARIGVLPSREKHGSGSIKFISLSAGTLRLFGPIQRLHVLKPK